MSSKIKPSLNKVRLAVCSALMFGSAATTGSALAQEDQVTEEQMIEEVVVQASRLKGTASAVLQERQNQAFVADIMGAEQISRTGDSDAAAALRRVTGLTLVDGKFIYVRGLGERYSSTQLNGMQVPSPDPTRSVMPLDLFPSGIIESLSVQKAFSPDMPAHFGGGNVDIRTKSLPSERIFKIGVGVKENADRESSSFYSGGGDDWQGKDDGTRALPADFAARFAADGQDALDGLTRDENVALMASLNRDIDAVKHSTDPEYSGDITYGDRFELDDGSAFGFLFSSAYKNTWITSNELTVNNLAKTSEGMRINEFEDGESTEHKVRWSAMLNFGYEYNDNHKVDFVNMILHDTRDRLRDRLYESTNTINEPDEERRKVDIIYEERELITHQVKGSHFFPEYWNIGTDWYWSTSTSEREAPGGFETVFYITYEDINGERVASSRLDRSVNTTYEWGDLEDDADSYGGEISIPYFADGFDVDMKFGMDFYEKERDAENISVNALHFTIPSAFLSGDNYKEIFADSQLADPDFTVRFQDITTDGDKYKAATMIDAYYFTADFNLSENWRLAAGARYEDFSQISVPFQPHSDQFDDGADVVELAFKEDDLFPSAALTYMFDQEMQLRVSYSQTAIRPDLRDISTTFYIDPLTEFLVRGSTLLESSTLDNFDVRWEWYMAEGNNLSVGLFYKDIDKPIEMIELPSATEGAPQLLTANAETGEVYGIEVEWLQDFSFISNSWSNFFVSGNITLSDSEVDLGLNSEGESLFEKQLKDALNTTGEVTEVVTNNERRLVGHSEWVVNTQFGWDSDNGNHAASLVYNAFGPRIIVPGVRGIEDGEEETFHSLDLIYTYYPSYASTLKFSAQNLLDEEKELTQEGVTILKENAGIKFGVSYSHEF